MGAAVVRPREWPLQPLLEASGIEPALLAELVGCSIDPMRRRLRTGISEHEADRWACLCGLPAAFVWRGWIDAAAGAGPPEASRPVARATT